MSTALTPYEASSISEALTLADTLHKSTMFAKYRSPEQIFAILAAGRELGMPPMQSLRSLHFYEGKVSMSSDLIVALVKRSPTCKYLRILRTDDKACEMETLREGDPGPTRIIWTIQDAQQAGLTSKDNWKKYPRDMLRARCGVTICRAVYPELAMGLYDSDSGELETGRAPVDVERPVLRVVPQPAPEPEPVEATIEDDLDMETNLKLSLVQADLAKCKTMADVDAVSPKAAAHNFEGRAIVRVINMFSEARRRVQG